MYLGNVERYCDSHGTQFVRKSNYLLFVQTKAMDSEIRAVVRKVALKQWGHWMMGTARMFGESITVSGSLGSDGLPQTVSQEIFDRACLIPEEVLQVWKQDTGHNGIEAKTHNALSLWAKENLIELSGRIK